MFCPDCKSEFRLGFTRCVDCDVDLVEHLSSDDVDSSGHVLTDSKGRELVWSGLSSKLLVAICEALDSAKIAHQETKKEFGLLPTMANQLRSSGSTREIAPPRDRLSPSCSPIPNWVNPSMKKS
jgi:hypothetical protein